MRKQSLQMGAGLLLSLALCAAPALADLDGSGDIKATIIGDGDAPSVLAGTCSILVDRAHDQNFDISGFTDFLVSAGATVDENNDPITAATLAGYDILIVPNRLGTAGITAFTAAEAGAVADFVTAGAGLWAIHEANGNPDGIHSLVSQFGITYHMDNLSDPVDNRSANSNWPDITDIVAHPVTDGVSSFGYYFGPCFEVAAPSGPLAFAGPNASSPNCALGSTPPVLAAMELGAGRAVFGGDSTPLHPNWYPDQLDAEEELLLQNIINWLKGDASTPVTERSWGGVKAVYR